MAAVATLELKLAAADEAKKLEIERVREELAAQVALELAAERRTTAEIAAAAKTAALNARRGVSLDQSQDFTRLSMEISADETTQRMDMDAQALRERIVQLEGAAQADSEAKLKVSFSLSLSRVLSLARALSRSLSLSLSLSLFLSRCLTRTGARSCRSSL